MTEQTILAPEAVTSLPDGEYAILEALGHRTLIGRISEVERFGTKLCAIEPIYAGALLPAVLLGGASIYQLTPCSSDVALQKAPKHRWQMPSSIVAILPAPALEAQSSDLCATCGHERCMALCDACSVSDDDMPF